LTFAAILTHNSARDGQFRPSARIGIPISQTSKGSEGTEGLILNAQLAVDGETGKYKEFKGNVATVYSKPLCQGGSSNGHYSGNAKTYMDIGLAMGEAMTNLLKNP
jgi:hypothetical protein